METKGNILMEKYEVGRLLGQGTFAKVYYDQTGDIRDEFGQTPNIVHLEEVLATKTKIYLEDGICCTWRTFSQGCKGKLKEDIAKKYFQQLICAVNFCHGRGVYHRDLKNRKIFVDEKRSLKVSDFGLSALSECKRVDGLLHTTCGTPAYVAPEVISRKGYDGAKADIWSCGVILFVLLKGYLPFHDSNLMEMYKKIARGDYKCPNWFPPKLEGYFRKFSIQIPNREFDCQNYGKTRGSKGLGSKQGTKLGDARKTSDRYGCSFETFRGCDNVAEKPTNLNAFDIISLDWIRLVGFYS
ncbi:hypothetical protein DH2020_010267 [Rehmannia glutinosa]|uniref:Protein kinase domain-containing protein n=1 Tax=Rehmannia glutinosa TaxID=99300 RepID=A0ABR0XA71_REHGL